MDTTTYMINISLVNEDQGYRFSDFREGLEDWLLREDGTPDIGTIFRECQREWGRCKGPVFVDMADGPPKRIGWCFEKREHYDDRGVAETYLQTAWVTLERMVEPARPMVVERVAV